ncbi:hypothetical protein [Lysobacter gummosus]|uniref:hypothetical protein n=1 Tax=Lysobacter gummosus TaxID=262324 RepID=UPI003631A052
MAGLRRSGGKGGRVLQKRCEWRSHEPDALKKAREDPLFLREASWVLLLRHYLPQNRMLTINTVTTV